LDCKEFEEKLDLYVDGRLGEADTADMQTHIRVCPECKDAYGRLRSLLEDLHRLPEQELPAGFHERLHERLTAPPRVLPFYQKTWFKAAAGAAAGIILLAGASTILGRGGAMSSAKDSYYAETTAANGRYYDTESVAMAEDGYYKGAAADLAEEEMGTGEIFTLGSSTDNIELQTDKLIYTAEVNLNSYDFDGDWQCLMDKIRELGGYVESSSISGTAFTAEGGSGRYGWITARVPQEQYQGLTDYARGVGEETYFSSRVENVSTQYTEVQTRIASLQAQIKRLQELIAEARNMDDLITLEARLSEVTYELESYQGQKKSLDSQIDYSTINITMNEQRTASTITAPQTRSFGQRMADAFSDGWINFLSGAQSFFLSLAYNLFDLILFLVLAAALIALVIFLVRRRRYR